MTFDRRTLLKNLALGFFPILVFVFADLFFGLTIGLMVAILVGVSQFIITYFREKRVDRFLLFDVSLIVALGLISLILKNDIFFKIKPGLIEAILAILLAFSGFSQSQLLIKMTGRYMPDMELSDTQIRQMRIMMRRMFYIITLHTALIFYSAFRMSTEVWGFVSGGLFYILVGLYMLFEFVKARIQKRTLLKNLQEEEWFDIVLPQGKAIGKAPRSAVHGNPDLLHPVIHVHIVNSAGRLFLQKRSSQKDLYPDRWDTAIGGHVLSGESIERALHREAEEELGISICDFKPLFRYVHKNDFESELVHGFFLQDDGPFYINRKEISEGRFWETSAIEENIGKKVFTPNFEEEFGLLKKILLPKLRTTSSE
jgi:isopentenyldiphosphate isomerase/intracellular septation protein A